MKRPLPWVEMGILALALLLRVAWLDIKPAHFDEGVNGLRVDQMAGPGYYHYDPTNYHGPLHFYAIFVSQSLLGRNLWALRLPAVIVGVLAVWVLLKYREFFGAATARIAALAMAVSPAFVFYERYSIHESWQLLFSVLFLWGCLGLWSKGERRFLFALVLSAAGMVLTKETYILHLGSFALAGLTLWAWEKVVPSRPAPPAARQLWRPRDLALAAGLGVFAIVFFYSGNFLDFPGMRGLYQTFAAWFDTGAETGGYEKKAYRLLDSQYLNYYWFALMARYEWPALLGLAACARYLWPSDRRLRFVAVYGAGVLVAYSVIPYKTPWCIISIIWPFLVVLGAVTREGMDAVSSRWPVIPVLTAIAVSLAAGIRLNFFRFDNAEEPYAYVQTHRDIRIATDPLLGMARRDPRYLHIPGYVLVEGYFPLPWILGDFTMVSYHQKPEEMPEKFDGGFVIADQSREREIEEKLCGDYYKCPFLLRDAQGKKTWVAYFPRHQFAPWFGNRPVISR